MRIAASLTPRAQRAWARCDLVLTLVPLPHYLSPTVAVEALVLVTRGNNKAQSTSLALWHAC